MTYDYVQYKYMHLKIMKQKSNFVGLGIFAK